MTAELYRALQDAVREAVSNLYELNLQNIPLQRPPQVELGDAACPLPFELARQLKRPPREIAQKIIESLATLQGVERAEVAGAGYVNFYFDRGNIFHRLATASGTAHPPAVTGAARTIVEHTNINPNKAAHVGHLRNAVLGDTFVRLLRHTGHRVEVQNYIDNTGVQVADVIVGFQHLEKKTFSEVERIAAESSPRLDQYCWDLYARVTQFYEEDSQRLDLRAEVLKSIEEGEGETARLAELVSTTIVRCHLQTMERIEVPYDVLPRESEILHLKFWEAAFQQLKERGVVEYATTGKNRGCWVMRTSSAGKAEEEPQQDEYDEAKVIVRSNGTVTYVGKDIAYQLWKFGLLGRDFGYRQFYTYSDGHTVWMSTAAGDPASPRFGGATRVYNVIDSRQSYLQTIVASGVAALGYSEQAANSVHFSYEMVGLSPRCARELGISLSPEDEKKKFVEVSGRKGQGVKADALLDALEENARQEVAKRHPDLDSAGQQRLGHMIAAAALRFFMLRYTRNAAIAFDFSDALSFEGETGPYLQYSVVRAQNIFRKWEEGEPGAQREHLASQVTAGTARRFLSSPDGDDLWSLAAEAAELERIASAAVAQLEPSLFAKWTFGLAQQFNLFYHRHHILSETDPERKAFLLLLTDIVQKQLTRALGVLGIEVPERM